jgi:hypothetical protein
VHQLRHIKYGLMQRAQKFWRSKIAAIYRHLISFFLGCTRYTQSWQWDAPDNCLRSPPAWRYYFSRYPAPYCGGNAVNKETPAKKNEEDLPVSELDIYEKGETSYFASQADQRFGYCLYVPSYFCWDNAHEFALTVIIHGSARTPQHYRSLFKDFAEDNRSIILAPLFPSGIVEQGRETNYKFILSHTVRFDRLLLAMIEEVRKRYHLTQERFLMHGFSGGGHFAHRFFYLHPDQLMGVSIGAPGMVTLLDPERDWHCGTRDIEQVFGQPLDMNAMRQVAVQMVIGSNDTETWEITIAKQDPLWMEGVNDAGATRQERLTSLRQNFDRAGINVRYDTVEGVGHEGYKILGPVKEFFSTQLNLHRSVNFAPAQEDSNND